MPRLEVIKLWNNSLDAELLALVPGTWNNFIENAFVNVLKVLDLKENYLKSHVFVPLMKYIHHFSVLEELSCFSQFVCYDEQIKIFELPATIKNLSIITEADIFISKLNMTMYNTKYLCQFGLTHLSVSGEFGMFPYEIFDLKELEYLNMLGVSYKCDALLDVLPCCESLRYLAVKATIFLSFCPNFSIYFPVLESLHLEEIHVDLFYSNLSKIFQCKTSKSLTLAWDRDKSSKINFDESICLIDTLRLETSYWQFLTKLVEHVKFPNLKHLTIEFSGDFPSFGKLMSVLECIKNLETLDLHLSWWNQMNFPQCAYFFNNLKSFSLKCNIRSLNLDEIIGNMPNLIDFKLHNNNYAGMQFSLPCSLKYFSLEFNLPLVECHPLINFAKNTPNLIRFCLNSSQECIIDKKVSNSDIAHYLQALKIHFQDEFDFSVKEFSIPIKMLKFSKKLQELVSTKSTNLPKYLNQIFPRDKLRFIKPLFMIRMVQIFIHDNHFIPSINWTNFDLILKAFLQLGYCLDYLDYSEMVTMGRIVLQLNDDNDSYIESKIFLGTHSNSNLRDIRNIYLCIANYAARNFILKLSRSDINFITLNFQRYSHASFSDLVRNLENILEFTMVHFENYVSNDIKRVTMVIEKLFLCPSNLLIPKIRDKKLDLSEIEMLHQISSFDYELLSSILKSTNDVEFQSINNYFHFDFLELDLAAMMIKWENFLTSTVDSICAICLEQFWMKKCRFFITHESKACHQFHDQCLDNWIKLNNCCPLCRTT